MDYETNEDLKNEMLLMQRKVVDEGLAVLTIFEGRDERVQESVINEFLNLIDPRIVTYSHFTAEGMRDSREIFKTMSHEPAKGKIAVYDRSWYSWIDPSHPDHSGIFGLIEEFERYFADNGVILIKFFLDSEETKKSVPAGWMTGPKGTFLSDDHKYEVWSRKTSAKILSETASAYAPWDVVKVGDMKKAGETVVRTFIDRVEGRVKTGYPATKESVAPLYDNPREGLDLSLTASKYKSELLKLSKELNRLQAKLASSRLSMVVLFEGWDAAGKGGSIKRVTRALNPRGYYVNPVAAPTKEEGMHTYLWRFATKMPKAGHISIYDRSWYGRMMVEPIEGFCKEEEYGRSAREIRTFEKVLANSGCIVLKFWMEISPDEQLRRFNARAEDPAKQYKITDEDWRNREKWDVYEEYIDRMLSATNTPYAPWIAVESEDKKYGRLKVMRAMVDALSKRLD
jgi:polyphosphate kinase 2 (PPK2 family)